ncbi:isoprenylcysteine carboxylmethyltransferase family protein [bacterium]|nr:isoprenylcysteine carboxylmethyltransferase family protein [bacterium]
MSSNFEKLRKPLSRIIAVFCFLIIIFTKATRQNAYVLEAFEIAGYFLLSIATLGRIWSAIYICGIKNDIICKDGPYSIMRNPLYLFSFLGMIGAAWGANNIPLSLLLIPIFITYYYHVIRAEEKRLLRIFGDEFKEYIGKVPRFLPNLKLYYSRERFEIKPLLLMRHTIEAMCFVWFFFLLELLEFLKEITVNGHSLIPTFYHLPF